MDKDQGLCSGINNDVVRLSSMLLLVKCYDKKMVKSPFNCVIFPLTQPQVANQQKNANTSDCSTQAWFNPPDGQTKKETFFFFCKENLLLRKMTFFREKLSEKNDVWRLALFHT